MVGAGDSEQPVSPLVSVTALCAVSVGLRLGHLAPCCHRPRKCPCLGLQQTPVPEGWRREMVAVCVLRLCRKGRKRGLVPMGWCRPRSPGVELQF